jgi:hypothetical protein
MSKSHRFLPPIDLDNGLDHTSTPGFDVQRPDVRRDEGFLPDISLPDVRLPPEVTDEISRPGGADYFESTPVNLGSSDLDAASRSGLDLDLGDLRRRSSPSSAVKGAPGYVDKSKTYTAPSTPLARQTRSGGFLLPEQRKPKWRLLFAGVALLAASVGGFLYESHLDDSLADDAVAAIRDFGRERSMLYTALARESDGGGAVENSFCPPLTAVEGDLRFLFSSQPIEGFPIETRAQSAQAVADRFSADSADLDELAAAADGLSEANGAVVAVNVRNFRNPAQATDGSGGIRPGFLIGDAYIGSPESNSVVCSFRFFAASTGDLSSFTEEAGLRQDLLDRSIDAIRQGIRGIEAEPGRSVGRYPSMSPPIGF